MVEYEITGKVEGISCHALSDKQISECAKSMKTSPFRLCSFIPSETDTNHNMASLLNLSLMLFLALWLPTITMSMLKQDIWTDQSALLTLKHNMLDPSNVLSSWNSTSRLPVCNWTRVVCSARHQRVVFLNLSNAGLQGSISPHIGNLYFLTYIDFRGNRLQGELPEEMMHLRRLRYINLMHNSFTGDVPSWLGSLRNLVFIDLSNNSFTGGIPASLFNASKLEYLSLASNDLQGSLPSQISKNSILEFLIMGKNQISGSIPQSILNLTSLESLDLYDNSLSGMVPVNLCSHLRKLQLVHLSVNQLSGQILSSFGNCSELRTLSIFDNHFSGNIPRKIGNLTMLAKLTLGRNSFTGEIPYEIGNLQYLGILAIQENGLTGVIPKEIGNLQKLVRLGLSTNNLTGAIPLSIFNMSSITSISLTRNNISGSLPPRISLHKLQNLQAFGLGENRLSSVIPDSISNLTKLATLELSFNQFSGPIPSSLGTLTYLTYLGLANNLLTVDSSLELKFLTSLTNCTSLSRLTIAGNPIRGTLPSSIGQFSSNLKIFNASSCEIEGNIPREIGNISGLIELSLGENLNLNGLIPMEFRRLINLQNLDLGGNKISGHIPNYFCDFKELAILNLAKNQLTGQVPECFGNTTSLRSLFLNSNELNSTLPSSLLGGMVDLLILDLHSNSLRGDIPQEIGNMKAAILIDLSDNKLSDLIPPSIGGLNNLINLFLSRNHLQGSIPEKLGTMLSIELFDLSKNNLTGHIPMSLVSLPHLMYFNVSFNDLGGEIPYGGSFNNFTKESFVSNRGFCGGPPHLQFPPCPSDSTQKSSKRRLLVVAYILIPVSFVIFATICGVIIIIISKRRKSQKIPYPKNDRISFYELKDATDGFNESNLLASGSSGSVFKGMLRDGTMIATKVFNLEREGSFKSFDRECEVLRNVRHRNLVKVITSCSNLDFRALVLEYMPNGSLEKWLYSHNYFLDFTKRLDIMIDVASALLYLHHGCTPTIVHCDLKPANVLLDGDMIGRVCDFGIARLFVGDESSVQTKTLATIGYIAPEYGLEGKVSTMCDIYSFGILLMETFSRKKPTDDMFSDHWGLKEWVSESLKNSSTDFIDRNLMNTLNESISILVKCIVDIMELALTCTVHSQKDRIDIEYALVVLKKVKFTFSNRI